MDILWNVFTFDFMSSEFMISKTALVLLVRVLNVVFLDLIWFFTKNMHIFLSLDQLNLQNNPILQSGYIFQQLYFNY